MLKRNITYENPITKQEVTEEHYFHISKARMIDMQLEYQNEPSVEDPDTGIVLEGYAARLQKIVNNKDGVGVAEVLRDFILRSYGRNVNNQFLRSSEISAEFESTEAFSQLYFEICMDGEKQAEFISSVFPTGVQEEVNKAVAALAAEEEAKAKMEEKPPTPEVAVEQVETQVGESDRATSLARTTEKPESRVLTQTEMLEMDSNELKSGLAEGRYKLS